LGALHAAIDVYDAEGDSRTADALVARIQRLDRDDDIVATRALAREDFATAAAELERLAKQHTARKDLAERVFEMKVRQGHAPDLWKKLEAAVEKEPTNPRARLELADARYASGDERALRHALADSVEAGANPGAISN